jgi:hypothetical protein
MVIKKIKKIKKSKKAMEKMPFSREWERISEVKEVQAKRIWKNR